MFTNHRFIGNRVGEHDGDVRFLTGSRHVAVLRMRNEKCAIWPLFVAESPKFSVHLIFLNNTCRPTSRHQQNRGYGILLLCAQFSHGLLNSAMGQIPCSTERISSFTNISQRSAARRLKFYWVFSKRLNLQMLRGVS